MRAFPWKIEDVVVVFLAWQTWVRQTAHEDAEYTEESSLTMFPDGSGYIQNGVDHGRVVTWHDMSANQDGALRVTGSLLKPDPPWVKQEGVAAPEVASDPATRARLDILRAEVRRGFALQDEMAALKDERRRLSQSGQPLEAGAVHVKLQRLQRVLASSRKSLRKLVSEEKA